MLESGTFAPISMFFIVFVFGRLFPVENFRMRKKPKTKRPPLPGTIE
jgi:hypothetical protein